MRKILNRYLLVSCILSVALSATNMSHAVTGDLPKDGRIKLLRYDPNDIYTIYTLYGYQTNIEFSKNERVRTISVGDKSLWQIVPADHRLFIRPMADNTTTNMTIITDRHTYQFDIKSGAGELKDNPNMVYVARFTYPEKRPPVSAYKPPMAAPVSSQVRAVPMVKLPPAKPVRTVELTREPQTASPIIAPPPPPPPPVVNVVPTPSFKPPAKVHVPMQEMANFNYTYTGPDDLAPVQLYDDGQKTYMRFESELGQTPKIYGVSKNKAMPIDYQMMDGFVVMNSTHAHILLDYGSNNGEKVHIYNENLVPASM